MKRCIFCKPMTVDFTQTHEVVILSLKRWQQLIRVQGETLSSMCRKEKLKPSGGQALFQRGKEDTIPSICHSILS